MYTSSDRGSLKSASFAEKLYKRSSIYRDWSKSTHLQEKQSREGSFVDEEKVFHRFHINLTFCFIS